MPGWVCLLDRVAVFGGFGRHFFAANFSSGALKSDQKQNRRAGDWFIAAHLSSFRTRLRG
jgi:hypothetical protein